MRPRGSFTRLCAWALLTCGVLGCLAGEARADWTDVPTRNLTSRRHREPFCIFFSGPNCTHSLSIDGVGGYQRSWTDSPLEKEYGRLAAEVGYNFHIGRSPFHAGVAFEAGGAINDVDWGWHVLPKLRFRYWIAYYLFALEVSPGFVYEEHVRKFTGDVTKRMGAHGEIGVSIAGVFTPFVAGEWLREPDGTQTGNLIVGGRLLLPIFIQLIGKM